jgi:hypothetical protein
LPEEAVGVGETAFLAVRPERIRLARVNGVVPDLSVEGHPGTQFPGRLVRTVFMGDKVEHIVDAPDVGTLVVSAPNLEALGGAAPGIGEEVVVGWTDDAARIIRERRPAG